jgi:uncharacterized membrane protein
MMNKYFAIIFLSIIAIFNAAYLSYKAYQFKFIETPVASSFCDISQTASCSEVLKHPLSQVFGIPFPWIALFVYPVLLLLTFLGYRSKNILYLKITQKLALAGMAFNGFIIYREIFYIYSYCILCLICTFIIITIFALATSEIKKTTGKYF